MLIEKTPGVIGKKIDEGTLLHRYHSEIIQSYTRKTGSRVFASHFLQGSAHYTQVKQLLGNKSHGDGFDSKLVPLSLPIQENYLTLSNQKPKKLSPTLESYATLMPCVEKVKPGLKKHKKVKSGKRRRLKSSNKKKKQHIGYKQTEKCTEAKGHTSMNVTKVVAKATDVVPCPHITNQPSYHGSSKTTQLPSPISPYAENLVKCTLTTESKTTSLPPCISKSKSPPIVSPVNSKNDEDSKLPPHPPIISSSPSSMRSMSKSNDELRKTSHLKLSTDSYGKHSLEAKNIKKILKENSLKDRINLIHCYGNDYMTIAKQYETKRKKEAAMKDHQEKIAERAEMEKKKILQRKKIYALNRLMTRLEHEQFTQFMKNAAVKNDA